MRIIFSEFWVSTRFANLYWKVPSRSFRKGLRSLFCFAFLISQWNCHVKDLKFVLQLYRIDLIMPAHGPYFCLSKNTTYNFFNHRFFACWFWHFWLHSLQNDFFQIPIILSNWKITYDISRNTQLNCRKLDSLDWIDIGDWSWCFVLEFGNIMYVKPMIECRTLSENLKSRTIKITQHKKVNTLWIA